MATPARGPGSQVPRSAFLVGPGRSLSGVLCRRFQTCSGRSRESRTTPSRRAPVWPRSVTPSRGRDTRRKTPDIPKSAFASWLHEFDLIAVDIRVASAPLKDGIERPPGHPLQLGISTLGAFQRRVGLCSRAGGMMEHGSDLGFGFGSLARLPWLRRRKHDRCPPSGSSGLHGCSR